MDGYKPAFFGTLLALGVSLTFHVAPILDPSPPQPGNAPAQPTDGATPTEPLPSPSTEDPRLGRLRTKLAACRETNWQVVAKVIEKDARTQAKQRATEPNAEKATVDDSSFERQQAARCAIALQFAQLMLQRDKGAFAAGLQGVGTEAWIGDEVHSRMAFLEDQFSLSPEDHSRLEQGYQTLWEGHGRELQRLIEHEDWIGLVDASKTFWRDEDKLVSSLLGPEARTEYRASVLETRSAVIATLASLAGLPWDDKLEW